ncbi:endonuclease/exonuclease/phosphatase family protein [Pseudopedobacter beijingensis]|uniref:Endonuclease/exonuclease/phosphatase family protein n=1 Tax=Pseudopedobacter beijingensis TaxID=1207056 RepID=A0ABW4IE25_9SPHI
MKYRLLLILCLCFSMVSAKDKELKVLQFNIWQEGSIIENGFDMIVDEILRLEADIVTFSEVRNYNHTRFNDRIVEALAQKGKTFYSFYSYDSGILSRFPIISTETIFPEKDDKGSLYKAKVDFKGRTIAVYTAHLDYKHAANYLSRGYDGSTWKKLAKPVVNADSILADNAKSMRETAIALFIDDAKREIKNGNLVILGGDFNEPSHKDWTTNAKHLYDRKVAVHWPVTSLLENAGFTDAYRLKYPDAINYPGITFPVFNPDVEFKKLVWAPTSDDRDRIDYIFFSPLPFVKLKDIVLVGPEESIAFNKVVPKLSKDKIILPINGWPTDHMAVLATFTVD